NTNNIYQTQRFSATKNNTIVTDHRHGPIPPESNHSLSGLSREKLHSQWDVENDTRFNSSLHSIRSDQYYPTYLMEDDEEDADRWTFASSLSFDHHDKSNRVPSLNYIPSPRARKAAPSTLNP